MRRSLEISRILFQAGSGSHAARCEPDFSTLPVDPLQESVEKQGGIVVLFPPGQFWVSRCEPDFSTLPVDPLQKSVEKQGGTPAIFFL